jgi:hypothetical protein
LLVYHKMNSTYFFIVLAVISVSVTPCYAELTDTAYAKNAIVPEVNRDSLGTKKVTAVTQVRADTAIVRAYNGIPVFYRCRPLHKYTRLGYMTRSTFASYMSKAFESYTHAARKRAQGHLGILIDNLNFGTDSFDVVRFAPEDGRSDTAVLTTPIFVSAKPTKPYKVIRVLNDQLGSGSLNTNLQCYMQDAQDLHVKYDGIMIRDVNYIFGMDNIFVFRWKKNSEIVPAQLSQPKVVIAQDKK